MFYFSLFRFFERPAYCLFFNVTQAYLQKISGWIFFFSVCFLLIWAFFYVFKSFLLLIRNGNSSSDMDNITHSTTSKLFLLLDGKITLYLYQCLPTVDIVWAQKTVLRNIFLKYCMKVMNDYKQNERLYFLVKKIIWPYEPCHCCGIHAS